MSDLSWDQAGRLDIDEPRSWRTWQLVGGSAVALLVGMAIGYGERGADKTASEAAPATPASRSAQTLTSVVASGHPARVGAGGRTAPTTVPASTGTESPPGSGPGGVEDPPPRQVLLEDHGVGDKTTARFSVGPGGWALGWGYDCSRASGQNGFTVTVYGADGTPSRTDMAVVQEGASGTDVTEYTSAGPHYLVVTTACLWGVKVTGLPT